LEQHDNNFKRRYPVAMPTEAKVALVTGGAKRVGRAIVERLASSGYDIAFTYLSSQEEAHELQRALESLGRSCLAIRVDLADPEHASQQIAEEFHQSYNRLDLLVNSASLYKGARLAQTDLKLMHTLSAIHIEAPLLLCQKFESLLRASHGHVINMVDLLAEKPWPQFLAYCASKAALANLTLGLAKELAPEVTVNGIAPGVVEWPDDYPEAERQKYLKRVPLNRAGTPQDVANLVHYLATEGDYITGQIIRLDGGRSIT
jgi:pteridine reductase